MSKSAQDQSSAYDAIIVGAGFAGLYMLHTLRGRGMRVLVIDSAGGVGGTWYWNRYPGARCDVVSVDYSYSFSEEIQQQWIWTEKFATQPEILRYIEFVADTLDLRRDILFNTRVEAMVYDEAAKRWSVSTSAGPSYSARFCIMATGCLSMPKDPDVPGLSQFAGPVYFASRWPHEKIDFSGQRVGLIGTGSSGIQLAPEIAKSASHLAVFQRTPSFTIPARNADLPADFLDTVKSTYAERRQKARRHPAGHLRPLTKRATFSYSAEERRDAFEGAWQRGAQDIFGVFGDLIVNEAANAEIVELIHQKIDEEISDPAVAAALKPRGSPFGARRICLDTDYYATFNRDNVTLVDVLDDPIESVVADGVKTQGRHHQLDALVLATGFDAMTGALLKIDIRGRQGRKLGEKWHAGPVSYLGIAIESFPNLFTITGPGSPSVLTNVIASIEQHVEWLADLFDHMDRQGLQTVEAGIEAEDAWVRHVHDLAAATLMMQANSWFLGANVVGKPRVFMPYAGGLDVYRDKVAAIAQDGYPGFRFEPHAGQQVSSGAAAETR